MSKYLNLILCGTLVFIGCEDGVGYCDVFWSSSDERTSNEWLEIASITNGYLKITTLLPPN